MDFVKFYIRKLTKAHGPIAQWNVFTIVTLGSRFVLLMKKDLKIEKENLHMKLGIRMMPVEKFFNCIPSSN